MFNRKFICLSAVVFLSMSSVLAQNVRIGSISPNQVQTGATAFPLVVKGSNFAKNSVVQINGVNLDTFYVSWNKLRAVVPANTVVSAGNLSVKVVKNNRASNAVNLNVSASPAGNYDWAALAAKLQTYISSAATLPPNTVRGLTMMISRHGRVVYSNAFGNQTTDSILLIASSTKMPSMLAIMTLVDDGRLNLDAPISTYLNGFVTVPADKSNITMRMLMNHISGMGDESCLGDQMITLQNCAQQILNAPLEFTPGTKFAYGGASMQVAGYVAEVISGQNWNQFFTSRIKNPLGLNRFTYGNSANPRVAGGASSDVGDYTKIMQTYLSGGVFGSTRIISPKTYYEMQNNQKGNLEIVNSPGGNTLTGYSYGWWQSDANYLQNQPLPQTVGLELSDQGLFGCTPWIDLEYNYTAIILINSRTATGTAIWDGVRPLIIAQMRQTN